MSPSQNLHSSCLSKLKIWRSQRFLNETILFHAKKRGKYLLWWFLGLFGMERKAMTNMNSKERIFKRGGVRFKSFNAVNPILNHTQFYQKLAVKNTVVYYSFSGVFVFPWFAMWRCFGYFTANPFVKLRQSSKLSKKLLEWHKKKKHFGCFTLRIYLVLPKTSIPWIITDQNFGGEFPQNLWGDVATQRLRDTLIHSSEDGSLEKAPGSQGEVQLLRFIEKCQRTLKKPSILWHSLDLNMHCYQNLFDHRAQPFWAGDDSQRQPDFRKTRRCWFLRDSLWFEFRRTIFGLSIKSI